MHPVPIVLIALLAFGVGFATQRGSVCGILAARQIVETGKISRLVAFVTASLWALAVVVSLSWLARGSFVLSPSFGVSLATLLGGALYGLGTFINGGCVFGTVARIASGNLAFLAALPGIALGAGLGIVAALPHLAFVPAESPLREPSMMGFAVVTAAIGFVALALVGVLRTHRRAGLRLGQILSASRWRTSLAMMIIGILGGVLFATGAPWSYPTLLTQLGNLTFGREAMLAVITIIGPLAVFAGAFTAAVCGGRFVLCRVTLVRLARSFAGGGAMGFAAILIPGGNDILLLSALPSLALHGAVAYIAMLGVQLLLCAAAKHRKDRSKPKSSRKRRLTARMRSFHKLLASCVAHAA